MARAPVKRFQYTQRDPGSIKRQANQRGGDGDFLLKEGVKTFKPKEGKNTIRIMPPTWADADHYGYECYINYGVGVDNNAYFSLSAMKKERDPLDEARKQAERDGNKKVADALKPTKRVIYYVIDRNAEEEGVMIWLAPWTFDKKLAALCIDDDTGAVLDPIDHPDEGCDIRFYYEKTGKQFPDYPAEKMKIQKPSPLHEDPEKADEWLEWAAENPIPSMLNFYDYERIAAAFDGHVRDDDEPRPVRKPKAVVEDDEDEAPQPKRTSRPAPSPKAVSEDEDDEGEVVHPPAKKNGNVKGNPLPDDPEEVPTSIAAIKARLAGRRSRQVDDD